MSAFKELLKRYEVISNIDRPLTKQELDDQLHQRQRVTVDPYDVSSVIRLNSTYLEIPDLNYGWRGGGVMIGIPGALMCGFFFWRAIHTFNTSPTFANVGVGETLLFFCIVLFGLSVIGTGLVFISYEAFRYTHYPIRFNRQSRMVYVFRRNGTVLTVPWNEVFFRLRAPRSEGWDYIIEGLVLDQDRKTVKEKFHLGYASSETYNMYLHWEYIRRYMEMGPQEVFDHTEFCLPIWDRRESPAFGFWRILYNYNRNTIFQILFSWFFLAAALGRIIAMWTSRIPQWPKEVEDACAIDPNDPYARDWRMNTKPYLFFFGRSKAKA